MRSGGRCDQAGVAARLLWPAARHSGRRRCSVGPGGVSGRAAGSPQSAGGYRYRPAPVSSPATPPGPVGPTSHQEICPIPHPYFVIITLRLSCLKIIETNFNKLRIIGCFPSSRLRSQKVPGWFNGVVPLIRLVHWRGNTRHFVFPPLRPPRLTRLLKPKFCSLTSRCAANPFSPVHLLTYFP